jgi:membrane protein YdbS with pleckstrin-like domain
MTAPSGDHLILALERPDPSLWKYYLLRSLVVPPLFPILALISWFKYHTLRYRFSSEGISMSWGLLFRREIIIQYSRIQDIHLHSNLAERWLGLARVQIQTASGNAGAEMTLEGLREFEPIRDFLYSRMRGVVHSPTGESRAEPLQGGASGETALIATLQAVADELRALRLALPPMGTTEQKPPHV